jgi:hypothetical protein
MRMTRWQRWDDILVTALYRRRRRRSFQPARPGGPFSGSFADFARRTNPSTDETLVAEGDDRLSAIDFSGDLDMFGVQLRAGAVYVMEISGVGEQALADPWPIRC